MEPVVFGLGSNLGDRLGFLLRGVRGLGTGGMDVKAVSSVWETPPLGYLYQPLFLNLVLWGTSSLGVRELLALCAEIEREAGRDRPFANAPRTLDVDLLFRGDTIVRECGARVPHPRWKERSFVVRPLLEILPTFRDPETGWRIEEVARLWPQEPEAIRLVEGAEAFRDAWNEGYA